jgi:hypothetical protein
MDRTASDSSSLLAGGVRAGPPAPARARRPPDREVAGRAAEAAPGSTLATGRGVSAPLDREFDRLLPDSLRNKAEVHFTPIAVARRAVQLLVDRPDAWILDVGSAVGKFCLTGAAEAPGAMFVGIERRRYLVHVANALAKQLALRNATFIHGDAAHLDWSVFDGFYLFNPFAEHLRDGTPALDRTIELDPAFYVHYVHFVRARLAEARVGTRVVTYHGFGAPPPSGYARFGCEEIGTGELELWVRTSAPCRDHAPDHRWSPDAPV